MHRFFGAQNEGAKLANEKTLILTIAGESVEELKQKLKGLAKEFGLDVSSAQMNLPLPETVSEPNPEKKIRAKKAEKVAAAETPEVNTSAVSTDAAPAAVSVDPTSGTQPVADAPAPSVSSREAAMAALQELNSKKGLPKAREVLLQFKANRFSELKETDFGGFVDACRKAVLV